MLISLIAAIQKDGGIGYKNDLLWDLKADLLRFRRITSGKPIIMGRKTYESIGFPLPDRLNIVISKNTKLKIDGCSVYDTTLQPIYDLWNAGHEEVFIIGGESIYKKYLPFIRKMYLTFVDAQEPCDAYFPTLDYNEWQEIENLFVPKDDKNEFDSVFKTFIKLE